MCISLVLNCLELSRTWCLVSVSVSDPTVSVSVSNPTVSISVSVTSFMSRIQVCYYLWRPRLELEVCGYSIFATRPVPVTQDRYPYPYPTRSQNYYLTRPVPAGITVPVTVSYTHLTLPTSD